jgi:hypothetical protein
MISAHNNRCAMCGKHVFVSDRLDNENQKDQHLENNPVSPDTIVEQIDGLYYTFDSANCALMFKKFNSVYGSNFADE